MRQSNGLPPHLEWVLNVVLDGESNKTVALRLGLRVHTVEVYVTEILQTLGDESRALLIAGMLRRDRGEDGEAGNNVYWTSDGY